MTFSEILEQWVRRLLDGEILYDPRDIKTRWVTADSQDQRHFRLIFNQNRAERLPKHQTATGKEG